MSQRITSWMAFSSLAWAMACGGSSASFDDPTSIALQQVPEKYAAEFCSAYQRCLGEEIYSSFLAGTDCTSTTEERFRNGEFPLYQAKIDLGKIHYDGKKVQACLDAIHAETCETLNQRPIAACEAALDGMVELGGECDLNAECKGANFCQSESGTCPGHCAAPLVAGQDCWADDQCASGLMCSPETKKCVAPASAGQKCEKGAPPCGAGLLCVGKDDTANTSGTCKTPAETFSAEEGASCDPKTVLCKQGLSCAVDALNAAGATLKCIKTGSYAAAGACKLAIPEACPSGSYCQAAGATAVIDGTCVPLPAAGANCGKTLLSSTICAAGTACVAGKCQSLVANGVSCSGDAMCYSDHCASTACQARLPCD